MADPTPDPAENVPRRRFERKEQPVDWIAAERSPEFRELIARKRRFVIPATAFFLAWYPGFIALAGYAPDFTGESIYEGFTVGYALALSQFVMTWVLGWMYVRRADDEFDGLAERAAARAIEVGRSGDGRPSAGGTAAPAATTTATEREEVTRR
jgi:uncharacterized membrane protein (DUF485 family)